MMPLKMLQSQKRLCATHKTSLHPLHPKQQILKLVGDDKKKIHRLNLCNQTLKVFICPPFTVGYTSLMLIIGIA